MRKVWIIVLCVSFYLLGVGTVVGVEEYEKLKSPYGELSGLTFVCGDSAYVKVFSGITSGDVVNLWNDFIVLQHLKIFDVHISINSPGGDAFAGLAIADEINRAKNNGILERCAWKARSGEIALKKLLSDERGYVRAVAARVLRNLETAQ